MTSAGTLNICSATTVDSPASPAPGSGNPGHSHAFGQQLRDANQSLSSSIDHPAADSSTRPARAAARRADKKGQADKDSQAAVLAPVAPPSSSSSSTALPLPLRFSLTQDSVDKAATTIAGPDPNAVLPAHAMLTTLFESAAQQDKSGDPAGQAVPSQPVLAQGVPTQPAPLQAVASQPAPQDLSFAVKVEPQEPSATVPPPAPVEVPVQLKLDDLAGQNDPGKNVPKPGGSTGPINPQTSVTEFSGSVTPIKETHRAELEPDPSAPGAGILARPGAFQPTTPGTQSDPAGSPPPSATRAQESAAIQNLPADHIAKPSAPLKDLSIQVGQNQQDKVELRVVERSGGLEVAVRSANPDLNQGLRQGLSELVNRLEQNGFRAEAWRPGTPVSAVPGTADTRPKSGQFQNDGSQSQSGSQQGRQQNQQNQTPRPRWVQELEGRLSGESNPITGGSYGLTN